MSQLVSYIKQYINLSEEAEREIKELVFLEKLNKGHELLQEGKTCNRFYFLAEGTIRGYYYFKGKDITHWVYAEGNMVTSWHSFIKQEPAEEYLEVTEASVLESITNEQLNILYKKYPELERFGRLIIEEQIAIIDQFYKGFYFLSAKEKYQALIAVFPSVIQRANLGHIASMLGISQETLSRIRGSK